MRPRTRRARFTAIVDGDAWGFIWDPLTQRLIARKRRSRQTKQVSAKGLVDAALGQMKLL